MSEMLGTVLKAVHRCDHIYTLAQLLRPRFFNLKIKFTLPTPFTSIQTPHGPQHLVHPSASQSPIHSQHARTVSSPNIPPPPRVQYTSPYTTSTLHAPPPGSTVVRPGDPRIGGTMCYKCLGSGVVQFLIFEDVCVVCGGVGRVFLGGLWRRREGGAGRQLEGQCCCLTRSPSEDMLVGSCWILFDGGL